MQLDKSNWRLAAHFLVPFVIVFGAGAAMLVSSGGSGKATPVVRLSQSRNTQAEETGGELPAPASEQSLQPVESSQPDDQGPESPDASNRSGVSMTQPSVALVRMNNVSETARSEQATWPTESFVTTAPMPSNGTVSAGSIGASAAAANPNVQPANQTAAAENQAPGTGADISVSSKSPYTPEELLYRQRYGWMAFNIAELNAINPSASR